MRHLGKIEVATATAKNNATTAVPFTLPEGAANLYLRTDAAVGVETASATSYVTTAAKGLPLAITAAGARETIVKPSGSRFLAVRNDSGGAAVVNVWTD